MHMLITSGIRTVATSKSTLKQVWLFEDFATKKTSWQSMQKSVKLSSSLQWKIHLSQPVQYYWWEDHSPVQFCQMPRPLEKWWSWNTSSDKSIVEAIKKAPPSLHMVPLAPSRVIWTQSLERASWNHLCSSIIVRTGCWQMAFWTSLKDSRLNWEEESRDYPLSTQVVLFDWPWICPWW